MHTCDYTAVVPGKEFQILIKFYMSLGKAVLADIVLVLILYVRFQNTTFHNTAFFSVFWFHVGYYFRLHLHVD